VPATCITKRGRPGVKGPKLIKITDQGLLKQFGYNLSSSKALRHTALDKTVKKHGALKVLHNVNALRTLQKSYPEKWRKLDNDTKYLEKKYFPERHGVEKSSAKPYSAKERKTPRTKAEVEKIEKAAKRRTSGKRKRKTV
jgi:hypothetical protein